MIKKLTILSVILILFQGTLHLNAAQIRPTCRIKVTPGRANINEVITVDMSGSLNAYSLDIEVIGPHGMKLMTKTLTPDSPIWQTRFGNPGQYIFRGKAFGPNNEISENLCEAIAYINYSPSCELWTTCLPCDECVGRPVIFEASLSKDSDGQVVRADLMIEDKENGEVIHTLSDSEAPFSWEIIFDEPGVYKATVVVTDDFGAVSEPCSLDVEIIQDRFFYFIDAGPVFTRENRGTFLALRFGLLYELIPDFLELVLSTGGAFALKGEPSTSFFMVNALVNARLGHIFIGAGLGHSTKVVTNGDPGYELLVNTGFYIIDRCSSMAAIFAEFRGPLRTSFAFDEQKKFMVGFRYLF